PAQRGVRGADRGHLLAAAAAADERGAVRKGAGAKGGAGLMSAQTSRGWRRPPIFTTTRITFALIVAAVVPLFLLSGATPGGWVLPAYFVFVLLTALALRSVRQEAGAWFGRRGVRRGLVVAVVAVCAALAVPAAGTFPFLVALLVLLNVGLG